MPSEPTEPILAAPAVLEALALASVAVPVADASVVSAVPLADDELPVVVVASVPVPVCDAEVDRVESWDEAEPEEEDVLVTPALAEEQLSPALMAEQKASAAGRTSLRAICSPHEASTQVVAFVVISVWCWLVH